MEELQKASNIASGILNYRCPRCNGLIVPDTFLCETSYWLDGLRCVNCGWVKLKEKAINYACKETTRRVNKLDELELYRSRSRGTKCSSHSI